jgi:hypothetical protein
MNIFIVHENLVVPTPEILTIKPFKDIWDSDTTKKKDIAISKFSYIEFMCSYKKNNPFIGYSNLEERSNKILEVLPVSDGVLDDDNVLLAIEWYNDTQTKASPAIRFYNASVHAADKMKDFLNTIDLTTTTPRTGAPLYKLADITRGLKDVADVVKTLNSLKAKVYLEIFEDSKGKSGREINYFEKT